MTLPAGSAAEKPNMDVKAGSGLNREILKLGGLAQQRSLPTVRRRHRARLARKDEQVATTARASKLSVLTFMSARQVEDCVEQGIESCK